MGTSIDPASKYGESPRCGEGGDPISESPALNKIDGSPSGATLGVVRGQVNLGLRLRGQVNL
ncbi:MAG: hypothetical protein ACKO15_12605, partial [Burkholderiales bacterium]